MASKSPEKKGSLNNHIENYVNEEEGDNDAKVLEKHKKAYLKAYARYNNIDLKVKDGLFTKKINPIVSLSFDRRVNAERDLRDEELKKQEEIVARNRKKSEKLDRTKRVAAEIMEAQTGLKGKEAKEKKVHLAKMAKQLEISKQNEERKKRGDFEYIPGSVIPIKDMPESAASRFIKRKEETKKRGFSKLSKIASGGKRKRRKTKRRKRRKTKRKKRRKRRKTRRKRK